MMNLTNLGYLPDANVLIARAFEVHTHHRMASKWFNAPGLQWALCPFTEAGFIRYATDTGKGRGNLRMGEATAILETLAKHPGFQFHPVTHDWRTLTKPFFKRLHGHKQVTDAYLLGHAVLDGLVLATFDSSLVHLAGEHSKHVHVLEAK
jgi:predicted nucleic acid-binding protein